MHIQSAIEELKEYAKTGCLRLHGGVSEAALKEIERIYNKALPEDFKMLYRFSDGFETDEDIFNISHSASYERIKDEIMGSNLP